MPVERLDPSRIGVEDFPDPDNKGWKGQECPACNFSTNQLAEQEPKQ